MMNASRAGSLLAALRQTPTRAPLTSTEAERLIHDTRTAMSEAITSGDVTRYRTLRGDVDRHTAALTIARRREADAVDQKVITTVQRLRAEGEPLWKIVATLAELGITSSAGATIDLAHVARIDACLSIQKEEAP